MGLCHKYSILHLVIFSVDVEQPDNWCGPVDIKDFIWEKSITMDSFSHCILEIRKTAPRYGHRINQNSEIIWVDYFHCSQRFNNVKVHQMNIYSKGGMRD